MPKSKKESSPKKRIRPALTPDARENQLISMAVDLAEQKLRDGSASSQMITHFLKLASSKDRLEREKLAEENKLLKAKTENLQSQQQREVSYEAVLKALRQYSGHGDEDEY